ncbi:MAG: hypothetical protein WAL37_11980 [Xanthobacteraceae bacterium]
MLQSALANERHERWLLEFHKAEAPRDKAAAEFAQWYQETLAKGSDARMIAIDQECDRVKRRRPGR